MPVPIMEKETSCAAPISEWSEFLCRHGEVQALDAFVIDINGNCAGKRVPVADAAKVFTDGVQFSARGAADSGQPRIWCSPWSWPRYCTASTTSCRRRRRLQGATVCRAQAQGMRGHDAGRLSGGIRFLPVNSRFARCIIPHPARSPR